MAGVVDDEFQRIMDKYTIQKVEVDQEEIARIAKNKIMFGKNIG